MWFLNKEWANSQQGNFEVSTPENSNFASNILKFGKTAEKMQNYHKMSKSFLKNLKSKTSKYASNCKNVKCFTTFPKIAKQKQDKSTFA